jgi:hypothetical protein
VEFREELGEIEEWATRLIESSNSMIERLEVNPEASFTASVINLLSDYPSLKPRKLAVARVNYENTELSSEFSKYLVNKIEGVMTTYPELFNVVSQLKFQLQLRKNSLSIEDYFSPDVEDTNLLHLDALLFARYWLRGEDIEIRFELLETKSGRLIGTSSVNFPKSLVPEDISLEPENLEVALQGLQILSEREKEDSEEFKVKVWPDKGEGSLYREGESLKFYFKANKDCYVYLYHMNSLGEVSILFPNAYRQDNFVHAYQVYSVPDEMANFDFKVTPPFGSEIIKAVASLQPLENIGIPSEGVLFKRVGKVTDQEVRETIERSVEIVPKEQYAEDLCSFTTIK